MRRARAPLRADWKRRTHFSTVLICAPVRIDISAESIGDGADEDEDIVCVRTRRYVFHLVTGMDLAEADRIATCQLDLRHGGCSDFFPAIADEQPGGAKCTVAGAVGINPANVPEETVVEPKILFVDDEASALDGYRRLLQRDFALNTAQGGTQGLALIRTTGPYAVVVSDMRMPGMSGAEFLAQVRQRTPNTVRILLTGHAELEAAIDAVNRGNIFKFLTKPCKKEVLVEAINSGLELYRAAEADKELVKKAQLISRSKVEWDSVDLYERDDFEGLAGLPGPSQAKNELQSRFGTDAQCFVVLFKLTTLQTIEERYGDNATADYLKKAVEFLSRSLRTNDRLFHWSRDVLMMIVRRQVSPSAVRMEFARLLDASPQHLIQVEDRKIVMAISMTFDLLPIAQFSNLEGMFAAFDAKLIGQL